MFLASWTSTPSSCSGKRFEKFGTTVTANHAFELFYQSWCSWAGEISNRCGCHFQRLCVCYDAWTFSFVFLDFMRERSLVSACEVFATENSNEVKSRKRRNVLPKQFIMSWYYAGSEQKIRYRCMIRMEDLIAAGLLRSISSSGVICESSGFAP